MSDRLGREETMFVAFMLAALAIWSLSFYGHDPVMFVLTSGAVYFTWGEIYSLFPATCTDAYGFKYATTNAGMLYTAKGMGALLVPLASAIATSMGWHVVFMIATCFNLLAAALGLFVLKPMRVRHFAATRAEVESGAAAASRTPMQHASGN
jgi:OFA family oxalate/formate antiporter-like MFS transporter